MSNFQCSQCGATFEKEQKECEHCGSKSFSEVSDNNEYDAAQDY